MIKEAIKKVIEGKDLSEQEALDVMNEIMGGDATPAQIAAFLTALRLKGETVDEIFACATVMRQKAESISVQGSAVDTCGTGGDCAGTFNISTTVAFVVAGAGVSVAKHGNRSVSSRSGSADLLESLGVDITLCPKNVETCIRDVGIGFIFAPTFHKAMKYAIGPRREIGIRTVFNVLGPLTNPANVAHQVIGVYDERLTEPLARVLGKFGLRHALVVHGSGLDELSTIDRTKVSELKDGKVETYYLTPEQFGLDRAQLEDIQGGTPEENTAITRSVLDGEDSPYTDIVLLNAGAALYAADKAGDIAEGIELARQAIKSGKAREKLDQLIERSTSFGKEER